MRKFLEMVRLNTVAILAEVGMFMWWMGCAMPLLLSHNLPIALQAYVFIGSMVGGMVLFLAASWFIEDQNELGNAVARPLVAAIAFFTGVFVHYYALQLLQGMPMGGENGFLAALFALVFALSVLGLAQIAFDGAKSIVRNVRCCSVAS